MRYNLFFIMVLIISTNLNAYSYAAAGKEPTIDAREEMFKAINANDFNSANNVFNKYSENYKYLNDQFNPFLFSGLKSAIKNKNKDKIVKWLDISIASEIQRRVEGGLENIKQFNISKVMLAKANKFYKILLPSLDKQTNDKLNSALKKCIESIGNPGLFGVGAKPINIDEYKKNQEIVIEILKSL